MEKIHILTTLKRTMSSRVQWRWRLYRDQLLRGMTKYSKWRMRRKTNLITARSASTRVDGASIEN